MSDKGKLYIKYDDQPWSEIILNLKKDSKDPIIQKVLGSYYQYDNSNKAISWFKKAIKQGDVHANVLLGRLYMDVLNDNVKAYEYFWIAEKKGYKFSKYEIVEVSGNEFANNNNHSRIYLNYYLSPDEWKALAKKGYPEAMILIGQECEFENPELALKWYEKAAKKGVPLAQYNAIWICDDLQRDNDALNWAKIFLSNTDSITKEWESWRDLAFEYLNEEEHHRLKTLLINCFPENRKFKSSDYITCFHQPIAQINDKKLFLSYIKETVEKKTNEIYVQRIERNIPLTDIDSNFLFEYHFGQADWKYPGIWYWYSDNTDEVETKIYILDTNDWNIELTDGSRESGGETTEWEHFWFPSTKKAEHSFNELFKKLNEH